jgi:hypothetical protein
MSERLIPATFRLGRTPVAEIKDFERTAARYHDIPRDSTLLLHVTCTFRPERLVGWFGGKVY